MTDAMTDNVTEMATRQPHYRITGSDGNQYVLPVALVRDVANGKQPLSHLDAAVLQTMVREWHEAHSA